MSLSEELDTTTHASAGTVDRHDTTQTFESTDPATGAVVGVFPVHDEDAVRASHTAASLARVRYENGASDFLQVLDAERTLLESEDRLARSRTEAATSLIAVYKALGGGWQTGT
jgi:acyl-CoA reductase-like NAD-dependent aldehyde dehydrogenase